MLKVETIEGRVKVEAGGADEEPDGLGMRFEGEPVQGHPDPVGEPGEPGVPVQADGDCSLEEMTRNAARLAMENEKSAVNRG